MNQWKTGQTIREGTDQGKDVGLVNAMAFWGDKLAGFADQIERIEYALKTLPEEPPSLPQFVRMCNSAPAKDVPALRYTPTPEDEERARQAAKQAARVIKRRASVGIDTFWATHPRSHMQMKFIRDSAQNDARFRQCIDEMVEKGICTEEGHLLKTYRDGQWWPVVRRAA